MRVMVLGAGYVGLPLAETLAGAGHEVFAARRQWGHAPKGLHAIQVNVAQRESLESLPSHPDAIVFCAAPSAGGTDAYRELYLHGIQNLLDWLPAASSCRLVYTSSTGVYGQNDGSTVTEQSPADPDSSNGRVLREAETRLLRAEGHPRLSPIVLRVAGIYGPGRGYWFRAFLAGEAKLEGTGERWLNMIHRDDVVGCIIAALQTGVGGEIYNAVDREPVRQIDLFRWLSWRLNRPMPESATPMGERASGRNVTNKRVSGEKLVERLGYNFLYPTFRQGFESALAPS